MGTILTTVLIAAPLAFMAGWLLSKAVFTHMAVTRPNAHHAQAKPVTPDAPTQPENEVIQHLQQQLNISQVDKQAASSEITLLKEAVAEREHQLAEIRNQLKLAQAQTPPEQDKAGAEAIRNVQQAKETRAIQQQVDAKTQEILNLKRLLIKTETRLEQAKSRFRRWRIRIKPLAKQFRQQRLIITELREELRQREMAREQAVQRINQKQAETAKPELVQAGPPAVIHAAAINTPTAVEKQLRDNLEDLRGIGPALHRKLNDKGIFRLQQLADMNTDELAALGRSVGVSQKLIRKHDWSLQAQEKLGLHEKATATA